MITPARTGNVASLVPSNPISTTSASSPGAALASSTSSAIDANMRAPSPGAGAVQPGATTRPPGSPVTRAQASVQFGAKWLGEINRMASLMGVDVGRSLKPLERDQQRVLRDLNNHVPADRLTADTDRLLRDWGNQAMQGLPSLRKGLLRNTQHEVRKASFDLYRHGVTSPEVHGALREIHGLLRDYRQAPPPPPTGHLKWNLDHALTRLSIEVIQDVQKHPEHMQPLHAAQVAVRGAVSRMWPGLQVVGAMEANILQDLKTLGALPQPPWLPTAAA